MKPLINQSSPKIQLIFPNGDIKTKSILSLVRGIRSKQYRPCGFRFINCTNDLINEEFMNWFIKEVIPCLDTNSFIYTVCISNMPSKFQQQLAYLNKDYINV